MSRMMSESSHKSQKGMMDERVWSRLPEDIVERVLFFLPVADVLRLRCVCKFWNSFLSTPGQQLKAISDSTQRIHLLCLTAPGKSTSVVHVFNVELRKWSELSLSFLPPEMTGIAVIASSGGLLFLQANLAGETKSLTCNPLTKTWREGPQMSSFDNGHESVPLLTSMVTNSDAGTYKIIEAGANGFPDLSTKVFDSSTRSWTTSGRLPSEVTGFESEAVIVDNCLYGVTCFPFKLMKMELSKGPGGGSWSEVSVGVPASAVYPHLVEISGTLAMVALDDPFWNGGDATDPISFNVWKLDGGRTRWDYVSTPPHKMCQKYISKENLVGSDTLRCAAFGTAIYVSNFDGSLVLVYDFAQDSWSLLPACPTLSTGQNWLEQCFIFNPSLQIMA